jgi:hypothetical protein
MAAIVVVVASLVALCAVLARPYPPVPGVTWANLERIEVGMTEAQAEAVIGCQPMGRSRGGPAIGDHSPPGYHTALLWSNTECDILVYLDRAGRVIGREGVGSGGSAPPTWYDRLRKRLGLASEP